jgi:SAM-dependent methyltransferase
VAHSWNEGIPPEAAAVLRAGFDADAEAYQRTRPVCPPEMFDDLMRLAGLAPGSRVLEIGCGTGQATVPLAERGLAVTAVELGASLAALARSRTADYPAVSVVTSTFEDWQPQDDRRWDAVVAFNSLHWVDRRVRYAGPAALLRPGGALVAAGASWATASDAEPFWADVQEDYLAVGFRGEPPPPPEQIPPWHLPPDAADYFTETASLRYPPFQLTYSGADYLAQLSTQSGPRELGPVTAADFLARVRRRLDSLGWPELTATFVGYLTIGIRQ